MDLSVVIPCYNASTTILQSVDSVVKECVASKCMWEIIVVDDGSKDDSVIKLNEYLDDSLYKDNIILISQINEGAAAARNRGLNIARGEYVAFNDSDDIWLTGKLSVQLNYMNNHDDVFLLGCRYGSDNFQYGSLLKLSYETVIDIKNQVIKNYFAPPTVIFRRIVIDKVGLFNRKLRYAEEGYFFNNIVASFKSVYVDVQVAAPINIKARWGDSGLSGNLLKMEKGELFNMHCAYKCKYISLWWYLFAVCFSMVKFIRRVIVSKIRKLCK